MRRAQGGLLIVAGLLGALPLLAHLLLVQLVGLRAFLLADGLFQLIWAGVGVVTALLLVRAAPGSRAPLGVAALLYGGGALLFWNGAPPMVALLGAQVALIGWGIYGMTKRA